jgi:hypothetical protein
VERLHDALKVRWEMVYMLHEQQGCIYDKALVNVDINPLCILHCENRIGEQLFLDCLLEGFNNYKSPKDKAA